MSADQVPKQKTRGRPRLNLPKPDENGKCQHLEWFCPNKPKEMDPCDCPNENCAGCWYPCDKCGSTKCSPFCRRIRKSMEMRQAPIEWKKSF